MGGSCVPGRGSGLRICGLVVLYISCVLQPFVMAVVVVGGGARGDGFACSSMGEFGVVFQGQF